MLRIYASSEDSLFEDEEEAKDDERRGVSEDAKAGDGTSLGAVKFILDWADRLRGTFWSFGGILSGGRT